MVHLQTTMKFFSARCQQLYIYKGEKWHSQYCIVMYNKQSITWPLILSVQARAEQEHGTTVRKSVYIQLNEDHTFPSLNNYQYAKPKFSTSVWLSFLNGIQNTVGYLSKCLLAQGCPNMFLESHISNLIKHTWINVNMSSGSLKTSKQVCWSWLEWNSAGYWPSNSRTGYSYHSCCFPYKWKCIGKCQVLKKKAP